MEVMAKYSVNPAGLERARQLIDAKQYVLDSDWGDTQPRAADENAYLDRHSWEKYSEWFLGLTEGANDETKARYAFVFGDFRRVHRSGLIACVYRLPNGGTKRSSARRTTFCSNSTRPRVWDRQRYGAFLSARTPSRSRLLAGHRIRRHRVRNPVAEGADDRLDVTLRHRGKDRRECRSHVGRNSIRR